MQTELIGGFLLLGIVVLPFLGFLFMWLLASQDLFFTRVQEGRAKAIMINDRFDRLLMSYSGYRFKTEDELNPNNPWINIWEIIEMQPGDRPAHLPLIWGIYWVGIWPFSKVHTYRFSWTSPEQRRDDTTGEVKFVPVHAEIEDMDYVLVQEDIYVLLGTSIESSEGMPLDVLFTIPARVINPYKALFRIQHWLEATENKILDKARLLLGRHSFIEIIRWGNQGMEIGDQELGGIITDIRERYGVEIPYIAIRQVDPGSDEAAEFIKAQGEIFIAAQRAEANKKEGAGLAQRARTYYKAVSKIKGGKEMMVAESIRDSKLRVVTTSKGGVLPAVNVDVDEQDDQGQGGNQ